MNPVRQIASSPAWILFLAMGLTVACQSSLPRPAPSEAAAGSTSSKQAEESVAGKVTIHVTSNGWHTGIVVPRAALPADVIPEAVDFGDARYLSFGWGDAAYYPAPQPGLELLLSAAFALLPWSRTVALLLVPLALAAVGDTILFAGGATAEDSIYTPTDVVEQYDHVVGCGSWRWRNHRCEQDGKPARDRSASEHGGRPWRRRDPRRAGAGSDAHKSAPPQPPDRRRRR